MKKILALLWALVMIISMTGCSGEADTQADDGVTAGEGTVTETANASNDLAQQDFTYPMEGVELTYWVGLVNNISQIVSSLDETPLGEELQRQTGVDIVYEHPAQTQEKEQFNLMVASGEMTDLIEYNFLAAYPGGPEKAISDGVIIDLTELLPVYAPNLMQYFDEHPEIAKAAKTDTGKYYSFPFIRDDDELKVFFGPVVNGKWLDDLGLEYPETMDDWYKMLTLFKTEKGATSPLTFEPWMIGNDLGSAFIGAYGIGEDFYIDDNGEVKFGSIEPSYKGFLLEFNKWYEEGLLDPDYGTMTREQVTAKLTTGESGASLAYGASRLGTWLSVSEGNPEYQWVGVKYPVTNEGEIPMFSQKDFAMNGNGDVSISTNCENVEAALRYLDFGYSEKGRDVYNYGAEGESYEMIDGYPTYTDVIMNNPDWTVSEALTMYARAPYHGPFIQEKEYIQQYGYTYEAQKEANTLWKISEIDKHALPKVTPTPEESEELAMIMNEIYTYRDEMQSSYIMGIEDVESTYDTYVDNIKSMGIDRAIEIYTAALERFNNR